MDARHLLPTQIKARRLDRGLSQDQVAVGSKVDRATVSRLERGLKVYQPDLEKLAAFYGLTVEQVQQESQRPFTGELAPALPPSDSLKGAV